MRDIFFTSLLMLGQYFVASHPNSSAQTSHNSNLLIFCDDQKNDHLIGDHICHVDKVYDKHKVPGTLPLTINSRFIIFEIVEINEIDHSITIYFRIKLYWNDPGLSYKNKTL